MKRICIIIFCLLPLFAVAKERKLIFESFWDTNKKEKFIPVKGVIDDEIPMLKLNFENIGLVQLTITDQDGKIVYQELVHSEKTPFLTIDLKAYQIKEGMISITDGKNMTYSIINL